MKLSLIALALAATTATVAMPSPDADADAHAEARALPKYCLAGKECRMASAKACWDFCSPSNWDGSMSSLCENGKWSCCCTKKNSAGPWIPSPI
ncbi:uncharacterized protein LOC62_02G003059 [Vanrija pseudolonga]|uniref:Uncharacterized protein n=1 Tax=Vanrija pseudolonga TaxID=143232 RepID=A0AAF0Y3H9_9TREE|nr:hypothetical protein LOC62_02G003059 [Vanrija pseudolonga]